MHRQKPRDASRTALTHVPAQMRKTTGEELIGGHLLRVRSSFCEAGWHINPMGLFKQSGQESLHRTLQGDPAAVQTVISWRAEMCGGACRASLSIEQWQQQSPPVGHEHSSPAHAEQAVGDEHVLLIAQVHAGGHIFMADDERSLVGERLHGRTQAITAAITAAIRAVQVGQSQRRFKSASCRPP